MPIHGFEKCLFVHFRAALAREVARDFEWQSVGRVEVEGHLTRENFPFQLIQAFVQPGDSAFHRASKSLFLVRDQTLDGLLVLSQLRICLAIILDRSSRDLRQERAVKTEFAAKKAGAPDDHACDVVAAQVSRHDAVPDQKGGRPRVIRDDPIRSPILF